MQKAVLPLLLAVVLGSEPALADAPARVLTVTGEGLATVVPDLAWVSLGVSRDADRAGDAMALMATDMTAVMAALEAAGIAPTDIQTGQLSLDPRYDYSSPTGQPKFLGYTATTMVEVRVRDLSALGGVLDAVVQDGANRLSGIRFDVADKDAPLNAARRDAVADARARAELYADAAGFTLGALLTLSEAGGYSQPMPMYDMRIEAAMPAGGVPVAAGEVNYQATVTITYAIE